MDMLKINIFWAVFKKTLRMRHYFLFGPYFMPFFNGQFLKCNILPVSNDPVLQEMLSFSVMPTNLHSKYVSCRTEVLHGKLQPQFPNEFNELSGMPTGE